MRDTYFFYNTQKNDLLKYEKYFKKKKIDFIFLEDNEKNLNFLKNKFNKKKFIFFLLKDLKDLEKIAFENIFSKIKIFSSSKSKDFINIKDLLLNYHSKANLVASEYADFKILAFENIYKNLKNTKNIKLLKSFKNKFKNIPAIIVGAGPSLNKNINLLKNIQNKALIFAGGSSINALGKENINYTFQASIDKHNINESFKNADKNKICFYQNQMKHENFKCFDNKVLASNYSLFLLEKYIYQKLDIIQDEFNEGWTISTFLMNIAKLLSCNPIILVGMDLSYKDKKYVRNLNEKEFKIQKIKTLDIFNNEVITQADFLEAKKWIEEFKKENKDIEIINSTEGGLGFKNIKNIPLKEALDNLIPIDNLNSKIDKISKDINEIEIDQNKLNEIINSIYQSLKNTNKILDEYLTEIEKKIIDYNLIRLSNEIVYLYLLEPIWHIWVNIFKKEIKDDKIALLINKILFFKNIISRHLNLINSIW
jgi:hypothetical protein